MEVRQRVNKVYADLFQPRPRYAVLMGGRGAGRSTVESQYIIARLIAPQYFRCAIMRFILSDVRNSCFRELKDRAEELGILDQLEINESQMTITYGQNSIHAHGFRKSSGDQKAKLKSLANYTHVWMEEADEVPEEDAMQLDDSLRTVKGEIHIDLTLNPPPKTHWINKRWFDLTPSEEPNFYIPSTTNEDVLFFNTSYLDNIKNLDENTVRRYEGYKISKPAHYWNMIKGYVPETLQGKIYKGWLKIDSIPHEARLLGYGLDFGFDPDEACIVAIYYYNGGYILDQVVYQTRLDNEQLATILKARQPAPCFCDSAEPKSIAEMRKYNVDVHPCEKGADSVRYGIKYVQGLRISYTSQSFDIEKEYENYAWKITKDGDETGMEDPKCKNHAMSAVRYGLTSLTTNMQDIKKEKLKAQYEEREHIENVFVDAGL